jgi:hypothetical protein
MATSTIGPSKDHETLNAWEDAHDGNLTGSGPELAECYAMLDTTAVTIDGWTTTSSDYIKIYGAAGDRSSSNTGIYSTDRYRMEVAGDAIIVRELCVRIENLQFKTASNTRAIYSEAAEANGFERYITGCVIYSSDTTGNGIKHYFPVTSRTGNLYVRNCLFITIAGSDAGIWFGDTGTIAIDNNTYINCAPGVKLAGLATITIRNDLYSCDDARDLVIVTGSVANSYCATKCANGATSGLDDAGTGNRFSQTFTFAGASDYHLASNDAGARDYGLDLSASFTTDIDGQTRPTGAGTWDIGADEYVAAGATQYKSLDAAMATLAGSNVRQVSKIQSATNASLTATIQKSVSKSLNSVMQTLSGALPKKTSKTFNAT